MDLLTAPSGRSSWPAAGVIIAEAAEELRRAGRAPPGPGQVDADGQGRVPRGPPAVRRDGRDPDPDQRWGNAAFLESDLVLAVGARFGDRHTGDLDVYRGGRTLHPRRHRAAPRSARSSSRTWASSGTPGPRWRRWPGRPRRRGTGRRARQVGAPGRGAAPTLPRRDDFDDVPIKPPRVFKEINELLRRGHHVRHRDRPLPDLVRPVPDDLPAAPLPRLRPGRPARLGGPRRAWASSAPIPSGTSWCVVGDYSFQFLMEEIAVAAQYRIPFVIVMINNEYLGLIRQAEHPYEMNYAVDLHYGRGRASTTSRSMEAFGCPARRVERARRHRATRWPGRRPRPTRAAAGARRGHGGARGQRGHGPSLDAIKEFEPLPELHQRRLVRLREITC